MCGLHGVSLRFFVILTTFGRKDLITSAYRAFFAHAHRYFGSLSMTETA